MHHKFISIIGTSILTIFLGISSVHAAGDITTYALVGQTEPGVIGQLNQLLGISEEVVQEKLAAGKTPLQIAMEYGMPEKTFIKKFKAGKSTSIKKVVAPPPVVKKVKKVTKSKKVTTTSNKVVQKKK